MLIFLIFSSPTLQYIIRQLEEPGGDCLVESLLSREKEALGHYSSMTGSPMGFAPKNSLSEPVQLWVGFIFLMRCLSKSY